MHERFAHEPFATAALTPVAPQVTRPTKDSSSVPVSSSPTRSSAYWLGGHGGHGFSWGAISGLRGASGGSRAAPQPGEAGQCSAAVAESSHMVLQPCPPATFNKPLNDALRRELKTRPVTTDTAATPQVVKRELQVVDLPPPRKPQRRCRVPRGPRQQRNGRPTPPVAYVQVRRVRERCPNQPTVLSDGQACDLCQELARQPAEHAAAAFLAAHESEQVSRGRPVSAFLELSPLHLSVRGCRRVAGPCHVYEATRDCAGVVRGWRSAPNF